MSPRLLTWTRRTTHPLTITLAISVLLLAGISLTAPGLARRVRERFPAGANLRLPAASGNALRSLTAPAILRAAPPALAQPALPTPEEGWRVQSPPYEVPRPGPREVQATPAATPRPLRLPCRVTGSGQVGASGDQWLLTVEMEESAVDSRGYTVIPKGTKATGRVRLERSGNVVAHTSNWQVALPEEGGGSRPVEFSASYESQTGGIATGASGFWSVRAVARIGERRDDGSTPDPNAPPVSILTNQPPGKDDDLPKP